MGALTSKPFSFSARSWELKRILSADFTDPTVPSILIELSHLTIKRILPVITTKNNTWISDQTRFAYDGLLRQRLTKALSRSQIEENFKEVSKIFAYNKLLTHPENTHLILGRFVDASQLSLLNKLANKKRVWTIMTEVSQLSLDVPFQPELNITSDGLTLENVCFLLLNVDLHNEYPTLEIRLNQLSNTKNVTISFGSIEYPFAKNLGFVSSDLFDGTFFSLNKMLEYDTIYILWADLDYTLVQQFLLSLANTQAFAQCFSIHLPHNSTCIPSVMYNIEPLDPIKVTKDDNIILVGSEAIRTDPIISKVTYIGSHGDSGVLNAHLVIPTSLPHELNNRYTYDFYGNLIKFNFVYSSPITKPINAPQNDFEIDKPLFQRIFHPDYLPLKDIQVYFSSIILHEQYTYNFFSANAITKASVAMSLAGARHQQSLISRGNF